MDIQSSNLFAIPVHATHLIGFAQFAPTLIKRAEKLCVAGGGLQASNRHAFHSKRDFHLHDDVATAWLRSSIIDFATQALNRHVQIESAWSISVDKGGWLMPHNHFPHRWSGVMYLSVDHLDDKDLYDYSGRLDLLSPVPLAEVFGLPPSMSIRPVNGLALIFPGALQHTVYPHQSDKTRHSVAFNLTVGKAAKSDR
jgi:hypothetical protein